MYIIVLVVVIMFEFMGVLIYIFLMMIVVGVIKVVSELFGKGGIVDRMIWFSGFFYFDNKEDYNFGVFVFYVMIVDVVLIFLMGFMFKVVE